MSELRYWVGFSRVPHIGPMRLRHLLDRFGSIEAAWNAGPAALRSTQLPRQAIESLLYHRPRIDLDEEIERLERHGVRALSWDSEDYPPLLREIDAPPPVLYVRGSIVDADEFAVAVVGTRRASAYGKEVARKLVTGLVESGVTVVSGLAYGIDAIAHRAALDAGGRTIAVLGCGLDGVYPARHRNLAQSILGQGALVSDYPLGTKPEARNFPPRNRIISGLSLGTVIVEAGLHSGALITLQYALDQGRETFAVPGSTFSAASEGTNQAIKRGEAKLITSVEDVLDELHLTLVPQQQETRRIVPATPAEEDLLAHLSREPMHLDELVRRTGLPTATVSSSLALMELRGVVRRVDNTCYVLTH
ncbi:MAG: DNA-processing protein DprA [Anaerolineae bacterium]